MLLLSKDYETNNLSHSKSQQCIIPILHTYYLLSGLASPDLEDFKMELRDWWFQLYSRSDGAALDSSGFEHVFVGETREGSNVLGFHSWVYTYFEEKEGNFVYETLLDTCEVSNLFEVQLY